jgi:hypothetical protein
MPEEGLRVIIVVVQGSIENICVAAVEAIRKEILKLSLSPNLMVFSVSPTFEC